MKTIKIDNWDEIPKNYTGSAEHVNREKRWYLNGQLHRENGPAVEYIDGTKYWYLNGLRHRVDGPAVEFSNGGKHWYLNDQLHRVDGPAVEYSNGEKYYWIHDKRIEDENAYWLLINMKKLKGLT